MEDLNINCTKISKMTLEDIASIKDDLEKNFDNFWTYGILKSEIDNINSRYIVAKQFDEIVGFAGILIVANTADIMNIVTKINKRNLGIASKMLEHLISLAKQENCSNITLEVNENNLTAIRLYEKYNFEKVGLRKKYYNNKYNAILMTLYLKR